MTEVFWNHSLVLVSGSIGKSIAELVFLLVVFALVLAACVFTTRFIGTRQMQRGRNSNFKPLETYQVAQNRYLQLVQIGTRYFIISVTKENIHFIAEMKEEEIIARPEKSGTQKTFRDILSEFKVKVDKHDNAEK